MRGCVENLRIISTLGSQECKEINCEVGMEGGKATCRSVGGFFLQPLVLARPPRIALFWGVGENNQPAITISDEK